MNKKSSKFGLTQKFARKTFNQYAQRLEISEEIRTLSSGRHSRWWCEAYIILCKYNIIIIHPESMSGDNVFIAGYDNVSDTSL